MKPKLKVIALDKRFYEHTLASELIVSVLGSWTLLSPPARLATPIGGLGPFTDMGPKLKAIALDKRVY